MALISLDDAARRTGTSVWTWRKWASARRITTYKVGRRRLVDGADLATLLARARVDADDRIALAGAKRCGSEVQP